MEPSVTTLSSTVPFSIDTGAMPIFKGFASATLLSSIFISVFAPSVNASTSDSSVCVSGAIASAAGVPSIVGVATSVAGVPSFLGIAASVAGVSSAAGATTSASV